jgi:uncharacterized protein YndB with AHSA1/START domain
MTRMTEAATRSVVLERDLPHPPEKVWRALTETSLIDQWLMKNNFVPSVGNNFTLSADWGSVEGRVLTVVPNKTLSYTWAAMGLESIVTWTLTPTATGTHVRMEHAGFRPDQEQAYKGAQYGWQNFLTQLEQITAKLE